MAADKAEDAAIPAAALRGRYVSKRALKRKKKRLKILGLFVCWGFVTDAFVNRDLWLTNGILQHQNME
ncbi:hypothetical protein ACLB2K_032697 [Fragaria x ananassa]